MRNLERLIYLEEVDSTNHFAHELVKNQYPPNGTAILARYQSAGKGQKGNSWESAENQNLLCSLVFYPDHIEAHELFKLNQAVALAICEYLEEVSGYNFKVKWPNDIMFEEKKIAGILIENTIREKQCQFSIVGIGINLNQTAFKPYSPEAISLKSATGQETTSISSFCIGLRDKVMHQIFNLKPDAEVLQREYAKKLFGLNEKRWFESDGETFEATIIGVDESGKLLMESSGKLLDFGVKGVKHLFHLNA